MNRENTIVLFDIDGTLTLPRQKVKPEITNILNLLREKVAVGLVGGSDLCKIKEQISENDNIFERFDYVFSENGLVAHKGSELLGKQNIQEKLGEENLQKVINFALRYISNLDIPKKRGNFIELRNGMINISPIGRSCSQSEREEFLRYDNEHNIRGEFVQALGNKFFDLDLCYTIGGEISIDLYPKGWGKDFCLRYLTKYQNVYFFGDKTNKGGNDYDLFVTPGVNGYTVKGPSDTVRYINEIFLLDKYTAIGNVALFGKQGTIHQIMSTIISIVGGSRSLLFFI